MLDLFVALEARTIVGIKDQGHVQIFWKYDVPNHNEEKNKDIF